MTEHEVFVTARNRLAGHWCQGELMDGDGNVCLEGAINYGAFGRVCIISGDGGDSATQIENFYAAFARIRNGIDGGYVYRWNDERDRTEDEVLALLDKLIAETAPEPKDPEVGLEILAMA